jgi:hypothetical protein
MTALIASGALALGAGGATLGWAASGGGADKSPAAELADQLNKNEGTKLTEADIRQAMRDVMKSRLDADVAAGRITRQQADEMLKRFDEAPQRMQEHRQRHEAFIAPIAKALGMTADQLREQERAGKSLADLAKEKNVSREKLLAAIREGLKAAPKPGGRSLTDAELNQMAARIADRTPGERGRGRGPGHGGPGHGGPGHGGFGPPFGP